jgi:hypothetical protein
MASNRNTIIRSLHDLGAAAWFGGRILQWVIPALTGGILILGAQQGEQQRPSEQLRTRGWSTVKGAVNRVPKLTAS